MKVELEISSAHIETLAKASEAQNEIRIKIEKRLNDMN